jgi:hypothetical protein
VVAALPAGTNNIGDVDVASIAAGTNTIGAVQLKPVTSGGLSISHLVSAATTNLTSVKASAGQLYGWYIYNSNVSARKVAFHNTAGAPTAGSGVVMTLVVPGGAAANAFIPCGIAFSTGTTAVAASDLIIDLFYS